MSNLTRRNRGRRAGIVGAIGAACLVLASPIVLIACGSPDGFNLALNGISATMTTYDQVGNQIDQVKGQSFNVDRDATFDTTNGDGTSNSDSSVLLISLGKSNISHVGSTLIIAQDGLVDVSAQLPKTVSFQNTERGTPWINNLRYHFNNLWQGKARTLLIRSQSGSPIAIYAGNEVQPLATEVPKSTRFRIDGMTLFVYRADYTVYDNVLLK